MTRILSLALLLAVALPAIAAEPAPAEKPVQVPPGYVLVKHEDGTWEAIPPEIAAQMAETERIHTEAEARESDARTRRIHAEAANLEDPTTNGSIAGRPAWSTPTDPEQLSVCGFGMDEEALSGRKLRKIAPYVPDCLEAQAKLVDAVGRKANAGAAITAKVPFHSDGDSTGVMEAAPVDALSDNDGSVALGALTGYGVPYGSSAVFSAVQANALGWQAVSAGQLGLRNPDADEDDADDDTTTKVVVKEIEVVREPTAAEIDAAVAARLEAAGH